MNETIFISKINHEANFTTVDNGFIRNSELSWKAKGIFLYLLSLPKDWVINQSELQTHATDGMSSLRSGLKELEDFGYMEVEQVKNEKGQFIGTRYKVDEYGFNLKSEKPILENRISDNPISENQKLLNTNNNKILNKLNITANAVNEANQQLEEVAKDKITEEDKRLSEEFVTEVTNSSLATSLETDKTQEDNKVKSVTKKTRERKTPAGKKEKFESTVYDTVRKIYFAKLSNIQGLRPWISNNYKKVIDDRLEMFINPTNIPDFDYLAHTDEAIQCCRTVIENGMTDNFIIEKNYSFACFFGPSKFGELLNKNNVTRPVNVQKTNKIMAADSVNHNSADDYED